MITEMSDAYGPWLNPPTRVVVNALMVTGAGPSPGKRNSGEFGIYKNRYALDALASSANRFIRLAMSCGTDAAQLISSSHGMYQQSRTACSAWRRNPATVEQATRYNPSA